MVIYVKWSVRNLLGSLLFALDAIAELDGFCISGTVHDGSMHNVRIKSWHGYV